MSSSMDHPANGGECAPPIFKNPYNSGITALFYLTFCMPIHFHESNHNAKFEIKRSRNFRVMAILKYHRCSFATVGGVIHKGGRGFVKNKGYSPGYPLTPLATEPISHWPHSPLVIRWVTGNVHLCPLTRIPTNPITH